MSADVLREGAMAPKVRVSLLIVRDRSVLLSSAAGEPPSGHALPTGDLASGQSIAGCARALGSGLGLEALRDPTPQLFGAFASPEGGHEVQLALLVTAPPAMTPAPGWAFFPIASLPGPLEPRTAAILAATREGRRVVDLEGEVWAVEPMRLAQGAAAAPAVAAKQGPPPRGPSVVASAFEVVGAVLWVSALFLVLDDLRIWRGTSAGVAWVAMLAASVFSALRVGHRLRTGSRARRIGRGAGVMALAMAIGLAFVFVLGHASLPAAGAYFFLGMFAIPTYLLSRWRARKHLPHAAPRRVRPRVARALGWLALVAVSTTVLLPPLREVVAKKLEAKWSAARDPGQPDE